MFFGMVTQTVQIADGFTRPDGSSIVRSHPATPSSCKRRSARCAIVWRWANLRPAIQRRSSCWMRRCSTRGAASASAPRTRRQSLGAGLDIPHGGSAGMEARLPFSQILQGHYHASLGHPWRWKAHFEPNAASGVFRADRRMSLVMRTMKAVPKSGISKLAIGTARSAAMKSPAPNKRTLFIFRNRRTS
jgi:hypothetical protein